MKKIKDLSSFKEFEHKLEGMKQLLQNKKHLKRIGMSDVQILKLEHNYNVAKKEFENLSTLPDRYNEIFSSHGWIAFESLSLTLMKEAIEIAEKKGFEEAEQEVLNYYKDESLVKLLSSRLYKIPEFKKRKNIYEVAIERHFQGDYISSVPLFLMIMDGFVNDIENTGFFAEGTDLKAWDSIAAHDSGLSNIVKILSQSRKRTTTEPIEQPYRNGILHGRDLNYAHEKISVKAMYILFALGDWALANKRMKEGKSVEEYQPPSLEESLNSFIDVVSRAEENNKFKKQLDNWEKRSNIIGADIPISGATEKYTEGSPERAMVEFIQYVNKENYGKISQLLNIKPEKFSFKVVAGEIREKLANIKINKFEFEEVNDIAAAVTEIVLKIDFCINNRIQHVSKEHFRWVSVNSSGDIIPRGADDQSWKVEDLFTNKWEVYKLKK